MTTLALSLTRATRGMDRVALAILAILAVPALLALPQALASLRFTAASLLEVAPFLLLSVGVAAYAKASGADNLIARAFTGRQGVMIVLAALMGALSPFCSCGVIPLIAALLAMGVPLPPVMAFWLASSLMDPSMFALTAGTLGTDFALFRAAAAVGIGLLGGFGTMALMSAGWFAKPLRAGIGNGGCAGGKARAPKPVVWSFWHESARRQTFARNGLHNTLFLGKWLALAFLLESLMLTWVPAELVVSTVGGGWLPVLGATLVGVPAYLNGYAALPLVGGLIEQGMAPGAGMAFLLAGGMTSIPAAIAVYALARPPQQERQRLVARVAAAARVAGHSDLPAVRALPTPARRGGVARRDVRAGRVAEEPALGPDPRRTGAGASSGPAASPRDAGECHGEDRAFVLAAHPVELIAPHLLEVAPIGKDVGSSVRP